MNPTLYEFTLTFANNHQKTIQAYTMKIEGKYVFFYSYLGDFQEAFRSKNVNHISRKRIEKR